MSKSNRFNPHTREKEKTHRGANWSQSRPRQWSGIAPSGRDAIIVVESKHNPDNAALHNKRKTYEQMIVEGRFNKSVLENPEPVVRDVRATDKRTFVDALREINENKPVVKKSNRFGIRSFAKKKNGE